jgi:pimeloyl-ACP methyl ester carboxylesterase
MESFAPIDMIDELTTAELNGTRIGYRQAGHGQPLVLLHGFLCDSRCWKHQLAGLRDQFRVIAWDAPGAGASDDPPESFTTKDYVDCMAGFLQNIKVERPHVLGLSWGGILAQEFYRLYPNRPRCLVLVDTYAGWRGSLPEKVWKERLASCLDDSVGPPEVLISKFLPSVFGPGASKELREEFSSIVADFHPIGFRVMSRSCAEVDTRDLLSHIAIPTLVLCGDEDQRSPIYVARRLHKAIPNAELAIIPSAGHLSNMEQPHLFNEHVRRFCLSV